MDNIYVSTSQTINVKNKSYKVIHSLSQTILNSYLQQAQIRAL